MPDVARNSPCPCGSNRRYKDCHGAISGSQSQQPAPASLTSDPTRPQPRSTYRPTGTDWVNLNEAERDECGALMERALRLQTKERLEEASEVYAAVLTRAPDTHDALHMLGAIKLRRGDLAEARRLIVAASRLRPSYHAIEHNLKLLDDAERAVEVLTRQQPLPPIELCERALPILVDLVLRPRDPPARGKHSAGAGSSNPAGTVHLIQAAHGTDTDPGWLVRRLAALLASAHLEIWVTGHGFDPRTLGEKVRTIDADLALFPSGGSQIFVGVDVDVAGWSDRAEAERVVVICSPASPAQFLDRLRAISCDGARPVDLVFPSRAMASRFGSGHTVLPPPVELRANPAALNRDKGSTQARLAGLTVGVMGRNWHNQPTADEARFLKDVAAGAGTLALYDAGLLRYRLGGEASIRFHRRHDTGLEPFLDSLDCVLFCPEPWWLEGDGREPFTAMASGVPVLLPVASIFAEYIDDGEDGLLYGSREEALQQLAELRRTPARISELGMAARAKVARLVDPAALAGVVQQLVSGRSVASGSARPASQRLSTIAS